MPERKLSVGFIGAGMISRVHAVGYMRNDRARIVAVCDIDEQLAVQRAGQWGAKKTYTDYRELLKDPEVEAVEILLPHHLHASVAIEAAEAGKHISMQKPIAMTLNEADQVISAVRKSGVKFNIAEIYSFYPPILKASELIANEEVGSPSMIRIQSLNGIGAVEEWQEPTEGKDAWRLDKDLSGGLIFDDIPHHYFATQRLLPGKIEAVFSLMSYVDSPIEYPAVVVWKYADRDTYCVLTYPFFTMLKMKTKYYSLNESYEVVGDEGLLRISHISGELSPEPPLTLRKRDETIQFLDIVDDWSEGFVNEVAHFVECVLDDKEPYIGLDRSREQLAFTLSAYKSASEGRRISPTEM